MALTMLPLDLTALKIFKPFDALLATAQRYGLVNRFAEIWDSSRRKQIRRRGRLVYDGVGDPLWVSREAIRTLGLSTAVILAYLQFEFSKRRKSKPIVYFCRGHFRSFLGYSDRASQAALATLEQLALVQRRPSARGIHLEAVVQFASPDRIPDVLSSFPLLPQSKSCSDVDRETLAGAAWNRVVVSGRANELRVSAKPEGLRLMSDGSTRTIPWEEVEAWDPGVEVGGTSTLGWEPPY